MTDHAVSHHRVRTIKKMVAEIEPILPFSTPCWKTLIFLAEFSKMLSQQIELYRIVHVDAYEFAPSIPERFGQGLGVRDRLIKVHRCDVEPVSLPILEQLPKFCAFDTSRNYRLDKPGKLRH